MNERPVVSAIIIFWNAERFIEEAVQSVIAQTYGSWELLLVDDGATDSSASVAHRYAAAHPARIRCLSHPDHRNHGTSASRDLGIAHAAGRYIAFLDADDVWAPRQLAEQVAILQAYPAAAAVYGRTRYWYDWTGDASDRERDFLTDPGSLGDSLVPAPTLLPFLLDGNSDFFCMCSAMFRREALEEAGGFGLDFSNEYEDMMLHAKLVRAMPVFVANKCWGWYRQHPDSTWSRARATGRTRLARQRFLDWFEQRCLDDWHLMDPSVLKRLDRARRPYRHPLVYGLGDRLRTVARRVVPRRLRRWSRAQWRRRQSPSIGGVSFGSLRQLTPISRSFGYDRGLPVDRYYVEGFLAYRKDDVRGHVLEIGDATYTRRFGGDRVVGSDVLHVAEGNPEATIVADLAAADHIPSNTYDCIILTQTLHLIFDVRAAIQTIHRILKPGGVVLATFPGITQIADDEWGKTWYWSFSTLSARRLFGERFPAASVEVEARGNVLAAIAFLHGISADELHRHELDHRDPLYQVLITVRAEKG